jgi:hypothetical protein
MRFRYALTLSYDFIQGRYSYSQREKKKMSTRGGDKIEEVQGQARKERN